MIRSACLTDVQSIVEIAIEQAVKYEKLKYNKEKIHTGIINVISSAKHFCHVSADSHGKIQGVLIGLVGENLWAQRQNCNIVLWVSKIKGDGIKMLRQLREWVKSRRAIKIAGLVADTDSIDSRVWLLMQKAGFSRYGASYLLYN